MGLIMAEALYPGYSVSTNTISDLGATCNPTCVIHEPSAIIFNVSVFILGILGFIGSCFVFRAGYHLPAVLMMVGSVGAMGVGLFTETTGSLHLLFSGITFLFTGLSAVASYRMSESPLSYCCVVLGLVTLFVLGLYSNAIFFESGFFGLGQGGLERVMAYPAVIWVIGIGAHLTGRALQHQ